MKSVLIPLLLLVLGLGGGVGAALFLAPPAAGPAATEAAAPEAAPPAPVAHGAAGTPAATGDSGAPSGNEYARVGNQFLIPVVAGSEVRAMVILSLSLEILPGTQDAVSGHEPRLRDAFLQVLFDHANSGGFDGMFTATTNMRSLRNALRNAARAVLGDSIVDVLIVDIVRQDM